MKDWLLLQNCVCLCLNQQSMTTTKTTKRTSQHIGFYSFPVPYGVSLWDAQAQDSSPSGALTFLTALRSSQQMPNGRKICPSQQLLPTPRQIPELFLAVLLNLSSDVSHVWAVMWSILAASCSWKLFPFDGFYTFLTVVNEVSCDSSEATQICVDEEKNLWSPSSSTSCFPGRHMQLPNTKSGPNKSPVPPAGPVFRH